MVFKSNRVASLEEIKTDKIPIAWLIAEAYSKRTDILGNNGVPLSEGLIRRALILRDIEGWLSPYVPEEYWAKSAKPKAHLVFEVARMPQAHTTFSNYDAELNRLLMEEARRLNLLLTQNRAGRI